MNRRRLLLAFVSATMLIAIAPSARAQEVFNMDPAHFSIVFSIAHNNLSYTYGMFRQAQGRVVLDRQNPAACQFQLTINADSIDTNNAQRDTHLKSDAFFNVAQFPSITFASTGCSLDNQQGKVTYLVTGNLTMHGQTRQVTLPIQLLGEAPGPRGGTNAGFLTQIELKRSDYGMTGFLENNMVGDAVGVTVSFEAARQEGGAAPPPR